MIMKDLNPENMDTLQDYARALILSMISLKTLANVHVGVAGKGFVDTDQEERISSLVYSLQRILSLYQEQLESVLELIPEDQKDLLKDEL